MKIQTRAYREKLVWSRPLGYDGDKRHWFHLFLEGANLSLCGKGYRIYPEYDDRADWKHRVLEENKCVACKNRAMTIIKYQAAMVRGDI